MNEAKLWQKHSSVWFHFLVYLLLFGLLSLVLDSACLLDLCSRLALDITVCLVIDPACLDYDLLIKLAIGSYTLPTSPAHYRILRLPEIQRLFGIQIIMDPPSRLFRLRQGNRRVEDFVVEFCELCHLVDFNDVALKDIFRVGLNDPFRSWLPGGKIHWSLEQYIDYALRLSGSSFTVGIADEGPRNPAVTPTPQPVHVTPAKPKPTQVMCNTPKPVHAMSAKSRPAQVTSTKPRSTNVTSAKPQPVHVTAAAPGPAHAMPAAPGPAHAMPAAPGPAHAMPAAPGPAHAMPAAPGPAPVMAARPRSQATQSPRSQATQNPHSHATSP
ncbi:hypothetical protein M9458_056532 [Cirrhinus mrigala]|uniref:Uncharacterized protein n=1 Tax=Cirrhinus mrigala TaxID=683832 RepID=A0ABD0MCY2_CIRMR